MKMWITVFIYLFIGTVQPLVHKLQAGTKSIGIKDILADMSPTSVISILTEMKCKTCNTFPSKAEILQCRGDSCTGYDVSRSQRTPSLADQLRVEQGLQKYFIDHNINPKDTTGAVIIPILNDALCKYCQTIKDYPKRKECIERNCNKAMSASSGLHEVGSSLLKTIDEKAKHANMNNPISKKEI